MDSVALLAVATSVGIFATTIQTQDFRDCDGDRRIGRQTLPMVIPLLSRYTLLPILLAWSIGLSVLWNLSAPVAGAFLGLALFVALRFITMRDVKSDQVSYYIYNVCFASPILARNASADVLNFFWQDLVVSCTRSSRLLAKLPRFLISITSQYTLVFFFWKMYVTTSLQATNI